MIITSAESARIISRIRSGTKQESGQIVLGTVLSVEPISLQLDGIDFVVTTGILINEKFLEHEKKEVVITGDGSLSNVSGKFTLKKGIVKEKMYLKEGDRVVVARINNACFVILCKCQAVEI